MTILDYDDNLIFGQNMTITFQMKDYENTNPLEVIFLKVNNNQVGFEYTCIDYTNLIYMLQFSTKDFVNQKGIFHIIILAESNFYVAELTESSDVEVTILPIPIYLTLNITTNQVVYNTDLVIQAILIEQGSIPRNR